MLQQETDTQDSVRQATRPTVSVIIPAYNVAQYIRETLDSVFAQTFTDFEVVIVNDGSPDTLELERALENFENRIRYIKQENRGASAARNAGLLAARGEFAAFLDADDLWQPEYLSEQVDFLRKGGYDLVYADALIIGDSPLSGQTFMETSPSNGEVTFMSLIKGECNVITSGVVASREMILEVGLFDEQFRNAQDFELWLRLVRHGAKVGYQLKVLLRYRYRQDSLSGDAFNRVNRELQVLETIESTYDLTQEERKAVAEAISSTRANLELETGKMHLANRRYSEARHAFRNAHSVLPSLKLKAVLLLLKIAPGLLWKFYVRRNGGITEK